uniref:Charged multivesicular body protein 7 n=1 Tax=Parastrongyloides trichosuri TaxID=131310 RepID=A0A0N4Z0K7_PARTI
MEEINVKSCNKVSIKCKPYHPEQWEDNNIMSKMMSNLPNKNLNPSTHTSILKFWHEAIENYSVTLGNPFISLSDLKHAFRRNNVIPASLKDVVNDLISKQLFIDPNVLSTQANKVINGGGIASNLTWVASSVSSGISGMFNWFVNGNNSLGELDHTKYLHLPSLRKLSRQLLTKLKERQNIDIIHGPPELMSKEDFLTYSSNATSFSEETLVAILDLWITEKFVAIGYSTNPRMEVLKFNEHFKATSPEHFPKFEEIDASIYNLMTAIKTRENQINHIIKMNDQLKDQARECIRNKDKGGAFRRMKKYKSTEKIIEKMEMSKTKLEDILYNITLTKDNASIVELMKHGNEVMKNVNRENGITLERVDEIIEDIEEGIRDKDELESAISRLNATGVDDEELEEEFNELIRKENGFEDDSRIKTPGSVSKRVNPGKSNIPIKSRKIVFPDVPKEDPSVRSNRLVKMNTYGF